jgi:putative hydrolase of the HAD superfamily
MPPNRTIQAVTFDVGGTLIEPWPSVGHLYSEVASQHGMRASSDLLNARFKAAWRKRPAFDYTRDAWCGLVEECFDGFSPGPLRREFFTELYDRFAHPEAWRMYEDVLPTLDALAARGIRLGILSNWDERLRELLERLRQLRRFEVVTVSCEAGSAKPAAAIFARAARDFGLPPASILHVGDHLEFDAQAARKAGFEARLIVRGPAVATEENLKSLSQVITIIAERKAKTD